MVGSFFTNSHQDWRGGTYKLFNDWVRKQFGAKEMDSDEEAEVPVHLQKAKYIRFKVYKRGYFILPPRRGYKIIKERQRVIRGYIWGSLL